MSFIAAVFLFPLLLWLLSGGCGLLVERLCGGALPGLLVLPVGFGALVVVSQFTTWVGPLAPLTPLFLVVLAIAGALLQRARLAARWRTRSWLLPAAAVLLTYLLVAAPEVAAGRLTFAGYLLDTTGAIQVAGAERLLHHAHNFSNGLPAYGTTLAAYFSNGYPSGAHGVLAAVGWLSGQNLIWLYSTFQAADLSILALVLMYLARAAGLRPLAAGVAGTIASVPALVYSYALMGSIKELTALPMLVLMGALLVGARDLARKLGLRAVLPFGLAAGAALDSIGVAASPWVGLFGAGAMLAAVPLRRRRADLRRFVVGVAGLVVATGVLGLPTLGPLKQTLDLAKGVSNANPLASNDPGNLLRPLKFIQVLGVWLGESHRIEPKYVNQTYLGMGVVIVCIALGLAYLLRRRSWGVLAVAIISLIVWEFLHRRGTAWTDAKLLVLFSPVVVFVAMLGALGLARGRTLEGGLLTVALAAAVLASDGLLYHGTNLAPTARYEELASIGTRFSGDGPTLAPDFDEYAIYLLRNAGVDMPGSAYSGAFSFIPGVPKQYGHSYDLDAISLGSVERFRTIVMRRSPASSRPPANFRLVFRGTYYSVWQRSGPSPIAHMPLGVGGWQAAGVPSCRRVRSLALAAARAHADLDYVARPISPEVDLATASRSFGAGLASDLEGRPQLDIGLPARIEGSVHVKTGVYDVWLGGDVDRPLHVYVDGRLVGSPTQQSGDDGTSIFVAEVRLSEGTHSVALVRGGSNLSPDDSGGTAIDGVVFEPQGAWNAPVQSIAPSAWRSLCGRTLDWIEIA